MTGEEIARYQEQLRRLYRELDYAEVFHTNESHYVLTKEIERLEELLAPDHLI